MPGARRFEMRNLTKSLLRFSWSMSLFGLEQMGNLIGRRGEGNRRDRIQDDFDRVSSAAEERFGERAKTVYESGDRLQSEVVDAVFDVFEPENRSAKNAVDRMADVVERSAEALRDVVGKESSSKKEAGEKETGAASQDDEANR